MSGPIDVHQNVNPPADLVWALITDIENCPSFITGIDSVQRLDDGHGFGIGTKWRETRTMFGKSASEEMTVTDVTQGRSYTTESHHDNVSYTSGLSIEPNEDNSCVLSMHFHAQTRGLLSKALAAVVGRLMERSTRKLMQRDLVDIARAT